MISRYSEYNKALELVNQTPADIEAGIEHCIRKIRKDLIKNHPDWFNECSRILKLTKVSIDAVMKKYDLHIYNTVVVHYNESNRPVGIYMITDEYSDEVDDDCNEHIILV